MISNHANWFGTGSREIVKENQDIVKLTAEESVQKLQEILDQSLKMQQMLEDLYKSVKYSELYGVLWANYLNMQALSKVSQDILEK
jgi:hypothetical protein